MSTCARCTIAQIVAGNADVLEVQEGHVPMPFGIQYHVFTGTQWRMTLYSNKHSLDEDCEYVEQPPKTLIHGFPRRVVLP